ncbi:MAG: right-handed parallel beta-helix repeat-containing protein, partial [Verrucomicrobiales bacterium]
MNRLKALIFVIFAPSIALASTGGPDIFGYTFTDSTELGGPDFQWVDISETGEKILGPVAAGVPQLVAQVEIFPPNLFYGLSQSFLRVSRHGYISNDGTDPGDDTTNDCPLTVSPSSGGGSRHYVFHDQIALGASGWGVYHQYFSHSPHPHYTGGVHVVQWDQVTLVGDGSSTPISFQVLLFASGDVIYQYDDTPPASASASVGLRYASAGVIGGLEYSCNDRKIVKNRAVLFEPPFVTVTTGDDDDNGPDVEGLSFREAVEEVPNGGKIVFVDGIDRFDFYNKGEINLAKNMVIDASNLPEVSWYAQSLGVFGVSATYVVMHGIAGLGPALAVKTTGNLYLSQGGYGDVSLEGSSSLHAADSSMYGTGNRDYGGGLHLGEGTEAVLVDCTFPSCRAPKGGAARLMPGSVATFRRCSFTGCYTTEDYASAEQGAVFHVSEAELGAIDCSFIDNDAETSSISSAAILWVEGGSDITFSRCSFVDNESNGRDIIARETGGAAPVLIFRNCTLSDDSIELNDGSSATFTQCTFAGAVGGIHLADSASLTVQASAFFDGAPAGIGPGYTVTSLGSNITAEDVFGHLDHPDDQVIASLQSGPLIEREGKYFYHPVPGSQLIDAVPAGTIGLPIFDQRGFSRPADGDGDGVGARDVGAIEVAAALVVDTASNNPAAGLTLAEAIADTGSGGVIFFDSSLAGATLTPDAADLVVAKSIALDASSLNQPVNITPVGGNFRVTVNWTLTLRNVRIRGATSPLLVDGGASLTAIDSHFTKSTGGAVEAEPSGRLVFVRCSLKDNTRVGDGGAIAMGLDATMEMIDCQLSGNRANNGGAIGCSSLAVLEFTRCLFTQNEADTNIDPGNSGGSGGVIYQPVGTYATLFSQCTITGNCAANGGVFYGPVNSGLLAFNHSTVVRNYTDYQTSAAIDLVDDSSPEKVEFSHTILARNWSGDYDPLNYTGPAVTSHGHNLEDTDSVGFTQPGDLQNCDPLLAPLGHYGGQFRSIAPLADSPAIDAGEPLSVAAGENQFDGRRLARIIDGTGTGAARIDIGAQEAGVPISVGTLIDEAGGLPPYSLREAIGLADDGDRIVIKRRLNDGTIHFGSSMGGQGNGVSVDRDVMIDATRLPMGLTLSGGGETRLARIVAGKHVSFHAFEFTGGFTPADGGALVVDGDLLLSQCTVAENEAGGQGGGILVSGGNLRCDNVTIAENHSRGAGGAIADNPSLPSNMSFAFTTITDNSSDTGTA